MAPVRIKQEVDPDIPLARPTATAADTVGGLSATATAGVGVRIKQEVGHELDTRTRASTTIPASASVPSVQVKMEMDSGTGTGSAAGPSCSRTATATGTRVKCERNESGELDQEHRTQDDGRSFRPDEDIICLRKISYDTGKRRSMITVRCAVPGCPFFDNKHDFGTYERRNQHFDDEHPGFRQFYYSKEQIKLREEHKQEKLETIAAEREKKIALKLANREKEEALQKERKKEKERKKAKIQREQEQKAARKARAKLRAERKEKKAADARKRKDRWKLETQREEAARQRGPDQSSLDEVAGESSQPAVQPVPEIVFKEFQFNPSTKLLTRSVIVQAYEEGGRSVRKKTTTTYEYDEAP